MAWLASSTEKNRRWRKAVLDALFGAEEEFEYTSSTSINGA